MSELKKISPLLDHMTVLSSLGSHDGSTCYLLKHDTLEKVLVLKLISIPESEEKTDALLLAGAFADKAAAHEYYGRLTEDLKRELDAIIKLSDSPNIAPVLGYQVEPKPSQAGYDLYILMEHWQTLRAFLEDRAMTNLMAVNLGIDICNALCSLRQAGLLSQNLKPENIYADGHGHFLLGDLGVANMEFLRFSSLSEQYRSVYTPPEFTDIMVNLNPTMDTYALGMLLYRIYNGNHGPFEDEKTSPAAAESKRLAGEALPAPLYADYEIAGIILQACAPKIADRFQTPEAMRQALIFYMQRNGVTDDLIVPPLVTDPEPLGAAPDQDEPVEPVSFTDVKALDENFVKNFSPSPPPQVAAEEAAPEMPDSPPAEYTDRPEEGDAPPQPEPLKGKKKPVGLLIVAAVLVAILAGAYIFLSQWYFLDVNAITLMDKTDDSITVQLDTDVDLSMLTIACSDSFGHTYAPDLTGRTAAFTGLSSNTKYTVSVTAQTGRKLSRSSVGSVDITTYEATSIAEIELRNTELTGQVELILHVDSGPTPPEYVLVYGTDGEDERTKNFSGDTILVTDLTVGKPYTFRLEDHDTYFMTGQTEARFTAMPLAEAVNLRLTAAADGELSVAWDCLANDPGQWTVNCTGDDGFEQTLDVTSTTATFTDTALFATYTVTVASPALYTPLTLTIPANPVCVANFTAEVLDAGVTVRWDSTATTPDGGWQLSYQADSLDSETVTLESNSFVLPDPVANATYHFSLVLDDSAIVDGSLTAEVATGDAPAFDRYGITAASLGPGLFDVPEEPDWTWRDLGTAQDSFSPGEAFVCVLQSEQTPDASQDTVHVQTVLRNSDGQPVQVLADDTLWDDLWEDLRFVRQLTAPEDAGSYSIEFYIDGALLRTVSLTVA